MKIAVIGGTELIGSQVVTILKAPGDEAAPHSLSTGVNLLTGEGVNGDTEVVVNLTNSPTFDDASPACCQASMDHLLSAATSAGGRYVVILSTWARSGCRSWSTSWCVVGVLARDAAGLVVVAAGRLVVQAFERAGGRAVRVAVGGRDRVVAAVTVVCWSWASKP